MQVAHIELMAALSESLEFICGVPFSFEKTQNCVASLHLHMPPWNRTRALRGPEKRSNGFILRCLMRVVYLGGIS